MTATAETHSFQAEVNEILSIVVNSLYSNKEVFLRELISNASDALDKLAFEALTRHELVEGRELTIDLIPSKESGTLTIRDNGIGMVRDEVIDNLGTIAKSGTKALMQSLSGDKKQDLALIGQFGVGFYSSYLVADKVTVTTRSATSDESASMWESEAKGEFSVGDSEKESAGTNVILHMKEDEHGYLDEWTIKSLVRKYSDYVRYPIRLRVERQKPVGDDPPAEGEEQQTETVTEWETINSASALWTRSKSDIDDEQYAEFYKHLSHEWEPPLAHTHFKVEGTQELVGLLFVPSKPPMDLFERKTKGIRLFAKRVFVMEDCEEILPPYLRFVHGVVDSEDLPLNISREVLQKAQATTFIRKQVANRTLSLLEELAEEGETTVKGDDGEEKTVRRYEEFWGNFGSILKEGTHLDPQHKDRIAGLLRYQSSTVDGLTSLSEYVARMPEGQPGIYFITAVNLETARHSPHIESLRKRDYEVLLMTDPVDEWVVESLGQFDDKKLIAAGKGSLDLPESDEAKKEMEEKTGGLSEVIDRLKTRLDDQVKEVRVTDRLTESPACLVTGEHDLSPHLERTLRAHGQDVPVQKRILEINPDHPVVGQLAKLAADPERKEEFDQWSELVYDQALVAEGSLPDDPTRLARSIARLMKQISGPDPAD